jgi:oligosaccharyltransferase complex subunit delta (ribophorin II)
MRPLKGSPILLFACCSVLAAAVSWGFDDATLSVQSKGSGVGGVLKEK